MNKMFKEYLVNPKDGNYILDEFYEYTYKTISSFITSMQDINKNENKEMSKELLEFYLEVNRFSRILEFYNDHFICYYEIHDDDLILHVSCLDASSFLYSSLRRLRGSVLFSATLSPIELRFWRRVLSLVGESLLRLPQIIFLS